MNICQDKECPNYEANELNKCISYKKVEECPAPDYLNIETDDGSKVPCSDGVRADDERKALDEFAAWCNKNGVSFQATVDIVTECPTLAKLINL